LLADFLVIISYYHLLPLNPTPAPPQFLQISLDFQHLNAKVAAVRQDTLPQPEDRATNHQARPPQSRPGNAIGLAFSSAAPAKTGPGISSIYTRICARLSLFPILYSLFLILSLAAVPVPPSAGDDAAGQALADKIRSSVPTENLERHAVLLIDSKSGHKEIPVDCQVVVHANSGNWETIYQTVATNQQPAHRLVISHIAGAPNHYEYDGKSVAAADTQVPFAGSDYSIGDLGLEFLHWPGQTQMKGEMRLGQPCYVLVSTTVPQGGIARIKSYIDKDTDGLLIAEAYDTNGSLIKSFSLHGSSFVKVNGQYQLEKMEIQNEKTGSHTVLKFDIPKNP
jgi:hypothetical protein